MAISLPIRQKKAVLSGAMLWLSDLFHVCLGGAELQAQTLVWSTETLGALHFSVAALHQDLTAQSEGAIQRGCRSQDFSGSSLLPNV